MAQWPWLSCERENPLGPSGSAMTSLRQGLLPRSPTGADATRVSSRVARLCVVEAARWPAVPLCERDLLVSYDADDAAVVGTLVDEVRAASITCLAIGRPSAATSPAADQWRRELAQSVLLVSVIGPSSVDKPVLNREAGAALAPRRAIMPALVGIPPSRLHYLLSSKQVRGVETPEARTALASEPRRVHARGRWGSVGLSRSGVGSSGGRRESGPPGRLDRVWPDVGPRGLAAANPLVFQPITQ